MNLHAEMSICPIYNSTLETFISLKSFFVASFSLGSWFLQARNAHGTFAERIPQMKINNFKKQKR